MHERGRSGSPLIREVDAVACGELPRPAPHTDAELTALIDLLMRPNSRVEAIAIGHSRDDPSHAAAHATATAWQALGRKVLTMVDWPETAASWLRPARRLTAQTPD